MGDCIFCQIIGGHAPASFVYRGKLVSAFLDVHPINHGHVLIVPNEHHASLADLPPEILAKMALVAQEIQKAFAAAALRSEGSNLFLSDGSVAGQEVAHVHLHLTPRFQGDGHRLGFAGAALPLATREHLDNVAKGLAAALTQPRWTPPSLETPRLCLRPLNQSDVEAIFAYCSDPEVARFTTWEAHETKQDSQALVDYALGNYKRGLSEPYGITFKNAPEKVVGTIGWFWNTKPHKSIEIAYALARPLWGQGVMVEAARAVITEALRGHDINRISSRCISENKPSRRVMEKLGMEYEGTLRQCLFVKGRFVDLDYLSMSAQAFHN